MDGPTPHQVEILLTWLGASGIAFGLAVWGLVDALLDWWAAAERPPGLVRRSHVAQGRNNVVLALTFFLHAVVYLGIGLLVVLGPARITLTGPLGYIVLVPPLFVAIQVASLRINRVAQKNIREGR